MSFMLDIIILELMSQGSSHLSKEKATQSQFGRKTR